MYATVQAQSISRNESSWSALVTTHIAEIATVVVTSVSLVVTNRARQRLTTLLC
jgi:hypothetical protein